MHMMKVSEEDLIKFNQKHMDKNDNPERESSRNKIAEEYKNYSSQLDKAKEKLKD